MPEEANREVGSVGRTLPTFRALLDRLEVEWSDYRRALTGAEQRRWEALWQQARRHASASTNAAPLNPMEAALLSMLLEHEKRIAELEGTIEATEAEDAEADPIGGRHAREEKTTPS